MPVNAGPKYFLAEKKYLQAKTKEEKIAALEEMIRTVPKHKGTDHFLAQLKKRLSNLKAQKSGKVSTKPKFSIKKEGAAQICIFGFTQSGKSTLMNALTNVKTKVAGHPYTTKEPVVGMMNYLDLRMQLVEIPSAFDQELFGLMRTSDLLVMLVDASSNPENQMEELSKILKENKLDDKKIVIARNKSKVCLLNSICIDAKTRMGLDELENAIWEKLDLIRVYTKSPGKEKDLPALALKKNSTVKDVAKQIHKDFLKTFKFARVFNKTKFSGQKVGLEYKLSDMDVVEIHAD